jgi:diguanylate cyclase (GGDEF)-like protein
MLSQDTLSLAISFSVGAGIVGIGFGVFLRAKLKSTEARLLARLKETERKLNDERKTLISQYEATIAQMERKTYEVTTEHARLQGETEFFNNCDIDFANCETSQQMYEALFRNIERRFRTGRECTVLLGPEAPYQILNSDALAPALVAPLQTGIRFRTIFDQGRPEILRGSDVEGLSAVRADVPFVLVFPIAFKEQWLGTLCTMWTDDYYMDAVRIIRKLLESFARSLHRLSLLEDELRGSRVDQLTGLPNAKYLHELMPKLIQFSTNNRALSMVLLECDNLKEINDTYGHIIGDQMVKELAVIMQRSARIEQLTSEMRPMDHYVRYGGLQFVVVLEDTTGEQAFIVSERIREAVEHKRDWPGGVPKWSISTGIVTCPADGKDFDSLRVKAEVALMYVKERLNGNASALFAQVPRIYRTAKLSAKIGGSLAIFDPAVVLQSMSGTQKTGILTVTAADGRQFWAFFETGKLLKAHLANFRGDNAIIEFLSTFEEGDFKFQEHSSLDATTVEALHRMDASYNLTKSLDKNLIDGARAQDMLYAAKRAITNTRLFVKPNPGMLNFAAGYSQMQNPPSEQEMEIMNQICKHVTGRAMLCTILDKLDHIPTYMRWHASAQLLQRDVIALSKLAISFSV